MNNIEFKTIDELLQFLLEAIQFRQWETMIFRLSTPTGIELNINTKINDTFGKRFYEEFKNLTKILNDFYNQNKYMSIDMEIKLKVPYDLKQSIDPNKTCEAFYLDFYSDGMSHIVSPSYVENGKTYSQEPIKNWIIYILNIHQEWLLKKQLNG